MYISSQAKQSSMLERLPQMQQSPACPLNTAFVTAQITREDPSWIEVVAAVTVTLAEGMRETKS